MPAYVARVPIRFSDLDCFGHVNHAQYLTYCEDHRTLMFTQMGTQCGSRLLDTGFLIARLECDYKRSLMLADGYVVVSCQVGRLGSTSVGLRYLLQANGADVAEVSTVIVLTDGVRPRAITGPEREWFAQYQSREGGPAATPGPRARTRPW